MKNLITLILLVTIVPGFAQSNEELVKTAIEFDDVNKFLSKSELGEIYLKNDDGFVSLQNGKQTSLIGEDQSVLTLGKVIEQGDKYKIKFNIDGEVYGKVTLFAIQNRLEVRRAYLKSDDGKSKSKMVSLEF